MVKLIVLDESVTLTAGFALDASAPCTLGRHNSCDVVVQHKEVSRFHARIEHRASGFVLLDLDSANGTFVNRQQIYEPHRLETGDEISLGNTVPMLRFYDPDEMTAQANQVHWIEYHPQTMVFFLRGQPIDLSISQFRLLSLLYRHAGEVCTREQCAAAIWGEDFDPDQLANLDEAMNKLRRKLVNAARGADDSMQETIRKKLITTRPGLGYVLLLSPEQTAD